MSNALITTMIWIFNVPQRFIYLVPRVILSPVWWYWKLWDSRKPGFGGFFRVTMLVLMLWTPRCFLLPSLVFIGPEGMAMLHRMLPS